MSGRRRRDDEYGDRRDARDDRRDPRADRSAGEWGNDRGDATRTMQAGRAQAAGYGSGGYDGGAGYDRAGYGANRGTPDGYGAANSYPAPEGYGQGGYPGDQGAGTSRGAASGGYQGAEYGQNGYGAAGYNGASRDAGYAGQPAAAGYGNPAYGSDFGNSDGYGRGYAGTNGRPGGPGYAFEPTALNIDDDDSDGQSQTPRPIGRLSIYTLHDDKVAEFDRLAERAAQGVRTAEPDTLVYVVHVVPKAPMQRIIYEIYRDRAAFEGHERQPHIKQFAADRAPCVLATNVIDLRLKYAKVTALGSPAVEPAGAGAGAGAGFGGPAPAATGSRSQESWSPRALESVSPAASFTPAEDRYAANGQYAPATRAQYSQPPQYGTPGNAVPGADNGQYGTAKSHAPASGYAGDGYSGTNGYPDTNGYSSANGYSSGNGYTGANGYQNGNGYPSANGYPNGNGYRDGNDYPSNGQSNGPGGSGAGDPLAANGSAVNGSDAAGYAERGASAYGGQYGGSRYRELSRGSEPGDHPDNGSRYADRGQRYEAS
jgi:quinol monooxygenase YgiN